MQKSLCPSTKIHIETCLCSSWYGLFARVFTHSSLLVLRYLTTMTTPEFWHYISWVIMSSTTNKKGKPSRKAPPPYVEKNKKSTASTDVCLQHTHWPCLGSSEVAEKPTTPCLGQEETKRRKRATETWGTTSWSRSHTLSQMMSEIGGSPYIKRNQWKGGQENLLPTTTYANLLRTWRQTPQLAPQVTDQA